MVSEGLHPNVITYAAAVAACKHNSALVLTLLERMESENVQPNTIVLTSAIDSLARDGGVHTDQAYEILKGTTLKNE
jgi:predicted nucleic acid-binding protein